MPKVEINGEKRDIPEDLTLDGLVEWLKLPADRLAIERNQEVVARRRWSETRVEEGDRLELVHFVGGGKVS